MIRIQSYREYIADNPHQFWFKRKLYGWGWVPARWQGWATIGVYTTLLIMASLEFLPNERITEYLIAIFMLSAALIAMCYWKGEPPKWQWGMQ